MKDKMDIETGYVNEAGTSNEVGVTDDIGVNILKRQEKSLLDEKKAYEEGLESAEKGLDNYERQWVIDKRLMELQLENFGMLESSYSHKIHTLPEYWELEKQKYSYKVREETFVAEKHIDSYKEQIAKSKERLVKIDEELKAVRKQIEEVSDDE